MRSEEAYFSTLFWTFIELTHPYSIRSTVFEGDPVRLGVYQMIQPIIGQRSGFPPKPDSRMHEYTVMDIMQTGEKERGAYSISTISGRHCLEISTTLLR